MIDTLHCRVKGREIKLNIAHAGNKKRKVCESARNLEVPLELCPDSMKSEQRAASERAPVCQTVDQCDQIQVNNRNKLPAVHRKDTRMIER